MQAVISGRSGVAVLLDGDRLSSLDAGTGEIVSRREREIPYLLGDATDLQFLEGIEISEVAHRLEVATAQADALHLSLMLLDRQLPGNVRADAADELAELLAIEGVREYVEGVLLSHPLPQEADLAGAFSHCSGRAAVSRELLLRVQALQDEVQEVFRAWERIPASVFRDEQNRARALATAIREGFFRQLVLLRAEGKSVGEFQVEALRNPRFSHVWNRREILPEWLQPLQDSKTSRLYTIGQDDESLSDLEPPQPRLGGTPIVLEQKERQRAAIAEAMKRRRLDLVERFVSDLIDFQIRMGDEPIHICKSLCDLATKAKGLSLYGLQLDLTRRAVELKPDDDWSWIQYGDALLQNGQLPEALAAYDRALVYAEFPVNVVVRCGRAEVLKMQGSLDEALTAYEEIIAEFPEQVVARCGRAEVLKAQDRLDEALVAYEETISEFPENVVARSGKASILLALGQWNEALELLPDSSPVEDGDWIGYHIRGMVFLRMGRLDEAVAIFQEGVENCPRPAEQDYFRTAYAIACLKRKTYSVAAEALGGVANPQLENTAALLRFHAFGGAGDLARAAEQDRALASVVSLTKFKEIREELRRRFIEQAPPRHSDDWLIQGEIDLLLVA